MDLILGQGVVCILSTIPPHPGKPELAKAYNDAIRAAGKKHGLPLSKHPDSLTGPRMGISVGEASAIADEDPDLIWLEVKAEDYHSGPPSDYEPER